MRPVHRYLCYATEMAPREVLAPSSLPLQGSACAISAIEAKLVRPARVELARLKAQSSHDCVSADSTTGVWCGSSDLHREAAGFKPARSAHSLQIRKWCQAPDSHREAVRFELTRYANSRQLGGTRGQTRTDKWRFRKSPPFPSARVYGAPSWTRTNVVGLEGRLPVRRPGRAWSGRTESNRPVPRWQRCRAPCAPA